MVSLQIVDVLAKHEGPQVFAEKLDDIERIVEARTIS